MTNKLRKLTSLFTLLVYLFTQFDQAYAQALPVNEIKPSNRFELSLPQELGTIEVLSDSGDGPVLIHLQEVHGDYAVQQKIEKILQHLKNTYQIQTVFLEGSAFKLHPEQMHYFPGQTRRNRDIAEKLAEKDFVSGPELFTAANEGTQAYGIEDAESYVENGKSFVAVLKQKEKTLKFLSEFDQQVKRLSAPYLDSNTRQFLNRIDAFESGKFSFEDWLAYLNDHAAHLLDIDLSDPAYQIDWPMSFRFFRLQKLHQQIDLPQFEQERENFLNNLKTFKISDKDHKKIRQLLAEPFSQHVLPDPETGLLFEEMAQILGPAFDYSVYPNLNRVIGHLILSSELKGERLYQETENLSRKIAQKLAETDEAKKIVQLFHDYRLLQKLFALELTPEDYEQIILNAARLKPSLLAREFLDINRTQRVQNILPEHLTEIESLYHKALDFYEGAQKRDQIMIRNIEKHLKETGETKAVVVTGGFHAGPFREYFEKHGFHYALISPKISNVEDRTRGTYIETVLQNFRDPEHSPAAATYKDIPYAQTLPAEAASLGRSLDDYRHELSEILQQYRIGAGGKRQETSSLRSELRATRPKMRPLSEPIIPKLIREFSFSDDFVIPENQAPAESENYDFEQNPEKVIELLAGRNWQLRGKSKQEIDQLLKNRRSNFQPGFTQTLRREIAKSLSKRLKREINEEDILTLGTMGSYWYGRDSEAKDISDLDIVAVIKQPGIQILDYKVSLKDNVLFVPDAARKPHDGKIQLMVFSQEYFTDRTKLKSLDRINRQMRYETMFHGTGIILSGKDFWQERPPLYNVLRVVKGMLFIGSVYAQTSTSAYRILKARRRWDEAMNILRAFFPEMRLDSLEENFSKITESAIQSFDRKSADELEMLFAEKMADLRQNESQIMDRVQKDLTAMTGKKSAYYTGVQPRSELRMWPFSKESRNERILRHAETDLQLLNSRPRRMAHGLNDLNEDFELADMIDQSLNGLKMPLNEDQKSRLELFKAQLNVLRERLEARRDEIIFPDKAGRDEENKSRSELRMEKTVSKRTAIKALTKAVTLAKSEKAEQAEIILKEATARITTFREDDLPGRDEWRAFFEHTAIDLGRSRGVDESLSFFEEALLPAIRAPIFGRRDLIVIIAAAVLFGALSAFFAHLIYSRQSVNEKSTKPGEEKFEKNNQPLRPGKPPVEESAFASLKKTPPSPRSELRSSIFAQDMARFRESEAAQRKALKKLEQQITDILKEQNPQMVEVILKQNGQLTKLASDLINAAIFLADPEQALRQILISYPPFMARSRREVDTYLDSISKLFIFLLNSKINPSTGSFNPKSREAVQLLAYYTALLEYPDLIDDGGWHIPVSHPSGSILDLAAGPNFVNFMPGMSPNHEYLALDLDEFHFVESMIEAGRQLFGLSNVRFMRSDVKTTLLPPGIFDTVRAKNVNGYVDHMTSEAWQKILDWVKPGGELIVQMDRGQIAQHVFYLQSFEQKGNDLIREGWGFEFELAGDIEQFDTLIFKKPAAILTDASNVWSRYTQLIHAATGLGQPRRPSSRSELRGQIPDQGKSDDELLDTLQRMAINLFELTNLAKLSEASDKEDAYKEKLFEIMDDFIELRDEGERAVDLIKGETLKKIANQVFVEMEPNVASVFFANLLFSIAREHTQDEKLLNKILKVVKSLPRSRFESLEFGLKLYERMTAIETEIKHMKANLDKPQSRSELRAGRFESRDIREVLKEAGIDPSQFTTVIYPGSGNHDSWLMALLKLNIFPNIQNYYLVSQSYDTKWTSSDAGASVQNGIFKYLEEKQSPLPLNHIKIFHQDYFKIEIPELTNSKNDRRILIDKFPGDNAVMRENDDFYTGTLRRGFIRPGDLVLTVPTWHTQEKPFWHKKIAQPVSLPEYDGVHSWNNWVVYHVTEEDLKYLETGFDAPKRKWGASPFGDAKFRSELRGPVPEGLLKAVESEYVQAVKNRPELQNLGFVYYLARQYYLEEYQPQGWSEWLEWKLYSPAQGDSEAIENILIEMILNFKELREPRAYVLKDNSYDVYQVVRQYETRKERARELGNLEDGIQDKYQIQKKYLSEWIKQVWDKALAEHSSASSGDEIARSEVRSTSVLFDRATPHKQPFTESFLIKVRSALNQAVVSQSRRHLYEGVNGPFTLAYDLNLRGRDAAIQLWESFKNVRLGTGKTVQEEFGWPLERPSSYDIHAEVIKLRNNFEQLGELVGTKWREKKPGPVLMMIQGQPGTSKSTVRKLLVSALNKLGYKVGVADQDNFRRSDLDFNENLIRLERSPVSGEISFQDFTSRYPSLQFILFESVNEWPIDQERADLLIQTVVPDDNFRIERVLKREEGNYDLGKDIASSLPAAGITGPQPDLVLDMSDHSNIRSRHAISLITALKEGILKGISVSPRSEIRGDKTEIANEAIVLPKEKEIVGLRTELITGSSNSLIQILIDLPDGSRRLITKSGYSLQPSDAQKYHKNIAGLIQEYPDEYLSHIELWIQTLPNAHIFPIGRSELRSTEELNEPVRKIRERLAVISGDWENDFVHRHVYQELEPLWQRQSEFSQRFSEAWGKTYLDSELRPDYSDVEMTARQLQRVIMNPDVYGYSMVERAVYYSDALMDTAGQSASAPLALGRDYVNLAKVYYWLRNENIDAEDWEAANLIRQYIELLFSTPVSQIPEEDLKIVYTMGVSIRAGLEMIRFRNYEGGAESLRLSPDENYLMVINRNKQISQVLDMHTRQDVTYMKKDEFTKALAEKKDKNVGEVIPLPNFQNFRGQKGQVLFASYVYDIRREDLYSSRADLLLYALLPPLPDPRQWTPGEIKALREGLLFVHENLSQIPQKTVKNLLNRQIVSLQRNLEDESIQNHTSVFMDLIEILTHDGWSKNPPLSENLKKAIVDFARRNYQFPGQSWQLKQALLRAFRLGYRAQEEPWLLPLVSSILKEQNPEEIEKETIRILELIRRTQPLKVVPSLIKVLQSQQGLFREVSREAAQQLGLIGPAALDAVPFLEAQFRRMFSAEYSEALFQIMGISYVIARLLNPSYLDEASTWMSTVRKQEMQEKIRETIPYFLNIAGNVNEKETSRKKAIEALGEIEIDAPEVQKFLKAAAGSKSEEISLSAKQALRNFRQIKKSPRSEIRTENVVVRVNGELRFSGDSLDQDYPSGLGVKVVGLIKKKDQVQVLLGLIPPDAKAAAYDASGKSLPKRNVPGDFRLFAGESLSIEGKIKLTMISSNGSAAVLKAEFPSEIHMAQLRSEVRNYNRESKVYKKELTGFLETFDKAKIVVDEIVRNPVSDSKEQLLRIVQELRINLAEFRTRVEPVETEDDPINDVIGNWLTAINMHLQVSKVLTPEQIQGWFDRLFENIQAIKIIKNHGELKNLAEYRTSSSEFDISSLISRSEIRSTAQNFLAYKLKPRDIDYFWNQLKREFPAIRDEDKAQLELLLSQTVKQSLRPEDLNRIPNRFKTLVEDMTQPRFYLAQTSDAIKTKFNIGSVLIAFDQSGGWGHLFLLDKTGKNDLIADKRFAIKQLSKNTETAKAGKTEPLAPVFNRSIVGRFISDLFDQGEERVELYLTGYYRTDSMDKPAKLEDPVPVLELFSKTGIRKSDADSGQTIKNEIVSALVIERMKPELIEAALTKARLSGREFKGDDFLIERKGIYFSDLAKEEDGKLVLTPAEEDMFEHFMDTLSHEDLKYAQRRGIVYIKPLTVEATDERELLEETEKSGSLLSPVPQKVEVLTDRTLLVSFIAKQKIEEEFQDLLKASAVSENNRSQRKIQLRNQIGKDLVNILKGGAQKSHAGFGDHAPLFNTNVGGSASSALRLYYAAKGGPIGSEKETLTLVALTDAEHKPSRNGHIRGRYKEVADYAALVRNNQMQTLDAAASRAFLEKVFGITYKARPAEKKRSEIRSNQSSPEFSEPGELRATARHGEFVWRFEDEARKIYYFKMDPQNDTLKNEFLGRRFARELWRANIARGRKISLGQFKNIDPEIQQQWGKYIKDWQNYLKRIGRNINAEQLEGLLTEDAGSLQSLEDLTQKKTSGISEMLAALAVSGAVDYDLYHNVRTPAIKNKKRFVLFDLAHMGSVYKRKLNSLFFYEPALILAGLESDLTPENFLKAIRRIQKINPKKYRQIALEEGFSNQDAEKITNYLTIRQNILPRIVGKALRDVMSEIASDDERVYDAIDALADRVDPVNHARSELRAEPELIQTKIQNAGLKGLPAEDAPVKLMNLPKGINLTVKPWPQRGSQPFTSEEIRIFESGQGLTPLDDFNLTSQDMKSVRHTFYDRASGNIEIWAAVETKDQKMYYLKISGDSSTSSVNKLKALMAPLNELMEPDVLLQVSMGNQGDLEGNFTVFSDPVKGWQFFGAVNEPWAKRSYRVLVEYLDGQRQLGIARFEGDQENNHIQKIEFIPEGEAKEIEINPSAARFILSAYPLGWGDVPAQALLKESYTRTSDLRHLFGFPFVNKKIAFYDQLVASPEKMNSAFEGKVVDFQLVDQNKNPLDLTALQDALKRHGYESKIRIEDVMRSGDYFLSADAIHLIFQPAVYPVNALAVSRDGQHLAMFAVEGRSGNLGANYWSAFEWSKKQIQDNFGWKPFALFALDNGMDPTWNRFDKNGHQETIIKGRDAVNAALLAGRSETRKTKSPDVKGFEAQALKIREKDEPLYFNHLTDAYGIKGPRMQEWAIRTLDQLGFTFVAHSEFGPVYRAKQPKASPEAVRRSELRASILATDNPVNLFGLGSQQVWIRVMIEADQIRVETGKRLKNGEFIVNPKIPEAPPFDISGLKKTKVVMGRDPKNEESPKNVIEIPESLVSRDHFQARFSKGIWYFEDLNSSNGTYYGDKNYRSRTFLMYPEWFIRILDETEKGLIAKGRSTNLTQEQRRKLALQLARLFSRDVVIRQPSSNLPLKDVKSVEDSLIEEAAGSEAAEVFQNQYLIEEPGVSSEDTFRALGWEEATGEVIKEDNLFLQKLVHAVYQKWQRDFGEDVPEDALNLSNYGPAKSIEDAVRRLANDKNIEAPSIKDLIKASSEIIPQISFQSIVLELGNSVIKIGEDRKPLHPIIREAWGNYRVLGFPDLSVHVPKFQVSFASKSDVQKMQEILENIQPEPKFKEAFDRIRGDFQEGSPYLVFEHSGEKQIMGDDPVISFQVALQASKIVEIAHRRGLFHRDVKWTQFLFKNGVVKMTDMADVVMNDHDAVLSDKTAAIVMSGEYGAKGQFDALYRHADKDRYAFVVMLVKVIKSLGLRAMISKTEKIDELEIGKILDRIDYIDQERKKQKQVLPAIETEPVASSTTSSSGRLSVRNYLELELPRSLITNNVPLPKVEALGRFIIYLHALWRLDNLEQAVEKLDPTFGVEGLQEAKIRNLRMDRDKINMFFDRSEAVMREHPEHKAYILNLYQQAKKSLKEHDEQAQEPLKARSEIRTEQNGSSNGEVLSKIKPAPMELKEYLNYLVEEDILTQQQRLVIDTRHGIYLNGETLHGLTDKTIARRYTVIMKKIAPLLKTHLNNRYLDGEGYRQLEKFVSRYGTPSVRKELLTDGSHLPANVANARSYKGRSRSRSRARHFVRSEVRVTDELKIVFQEYREKTLPIRFEELGTEKMVEILTALLNEKVYSEKAGLAAQSNESLLENKFSNNRLTASPAFQHTLASETGGAGQLVMDASWIERLIEKNPRALYILLSALENIRKTGKEARAVVSVIAENGIYEKIQQAMLKRMSGLNWEEKEEVKQFLTPDRIQLLIPSVQAQSLAGLAEKNNYALTVLSAHELSGIAAVNFILEPSAVAQGDLPAIAFLVPALLKAAELIRGIKDPQEQMRILEPIIDQILPGASRSGNHFVIQIAQYIQQAILANHLIESAA